MSTSMRSRRISAEKKLDHEQSEHRMTWECIGMAQERINGLLDHFGAKPSVERGMAAMFLPEAISNVAYFARRNGTADAAQDFYVGEVPA